MQLTTNFKLKKIELADSPPDITVINSNWDTIDTNLKDALDKSRNWEKFKNGGGDIGGDVKVPRLECNEIIRKLVQSTIPDNTATTISLTNNDETEKISMWIGKLRGVPAITPTTWGGLRLGTSTLPFAELFIGNFSTLENGYTKLPNGMILQWGRFSGTGDVVFPMTFPNACLHVFTDGFLSPTSDPCYKTLSCCGWFARAGFTGVSFGYHSIGPGSTPAAKMSYRSTTGVANFGGVSRYLAIGY